MYTASDCSNSAFGCAYLQSPATEGGENESDAERLEEENIRTAAGE